MNIENITELSDEELDEMRVAVQYEQERRLTIKNAESIAARVNEQYVNAIGRVDGGEWIQPTGTHDAYREGAIVEHHDKEWESTTPFNVWEPGVSGWRPLAPIDPETGERGVAEWIQPTGVHDAYRKGDRVLFEEQVWESVIDNNTWSPTDYPEGWQVVKPEEEVEEEEVPVPDPEPEPEPEPIPGDMASEWVQPLGTHDAYQVGDRVLFEGELYESVIGNNTWSPRDYPQGWKKIV